MKKIYALMVFCVAMTPAFSQPLFTYGKYSVSKDEFLKAYNKNKTPVTDKEKSLREYLDLYAKFKLKVKMAETLRLDTLQQLQDDLQNFRSQVEQAYMNDEKGLHALMDEVIERSKKDIHLIHFSVPINTKMSAADTTKIYQAVNKLAEKVVADKSDYDKVVKEISAEQVEIKGKDLGYITAMSLPYQMENLVYGLKPGEVSKPYRTRSTLHLFKNAGERKSPGKWKIAQILFSLPPDASAVEIKSVEKRADSVYELLVNGADFKELAKQFSEDKLTYMNGGEMPEFGTGKFEFPFETKVFDLKKDGDISRPIYTGYGYHIVKRLSQREIPTDKTDESFMTALRQQVLADSRMDAAKVYFLKDVKLKTGFKRNPLVKDAELFRYADSVSANGVVSFYPVTNKIVCSFTKQNVKGSDWLNFVKDYKLNQDVYKGESNKELLDKYISTTAFEYYRKHLEEYNEAFKYQMQEFREGNMLFEIMERNVWSKAANDSVGLKNFYNKNQATYKWAESADILLFNCSDEKTAEDAIAALASGKDWRKLSDESDGKIQSDSGRYEIAQIQVPEGTNLKEGVTTKPLVNSGDNTSSFVKVLRLFPANQQRTFEEARGLVINEYQGYIETKWIAELKRKYPVKINEAVFLSLLQ